jgi:PhnB protein
MKIPENYLPIMPYLILTDAASFLEYTKKVFRATEQLIVPGQDNRSIMHGEIKIHDAVIMFAQANENWNQKTAGMFIYVDSVDRVYTAGIEQGGTSLQPPSKQSYGYAAGFEDPFGNQWWVTQPE